MWPKENVFKGKPYNHLIAWKYVETDFPWKVIILGGTKISLIENSNLPDFKTFLFLHKGGSLSIAEGFQVYIVLLGLEVP